MKLKLLCSAVLVIMISCGQNNSSEKSSENTKSKVSNESKSQSVVNTIKDKALFGIKSAKIIYTCQGGQEEGTETLYFDDYGNISVLIVDKKNKLKRNNQKIIWKDNQSIMIDHEAKTVSRSPLRPKFSQPPDIAEISASSRIGIGYEKLTDEIIAGKSCEVWFNIQQNTKYYLWKKIDLKFENQGFYIKEAKLVEEISSIPAYVLEIPKDYK